MAREAAASEEYGVCECYRANKKETTEHVIGNILASVGNSSHKAVLRASSFHH